MKGASKVIMGATLVMVVSLAIVLALILVLLAELYCSLLLSRRRRQLKHPTPGDDTATASATAAATTPTNTTTNSQCHRPQDHDHDQSSTCSPLSGFYAQGVLHAPRNFLFPAALPCKQKKKLEKEQNHLSLLHQVLEIHAPESNTSPHQIGILTPTSPMSSTSFATSPQQLPAAVLEISIQVGTETSVKEKVCGASGVENNFVYISNPIYDNEADLNGRPSMPDTPFETPDTSPSRLENSGSSGDDEENSKAQPCDDHAAAVRLFISSSPPLSPMKKLPAQACSISLRDASSLATSGSDSNSNNGLSSSSSGSPCTSPSW